MNLLWVKKIKTKKILKKLYKKYSYSILKLIILNNYKIIKYLFDNELQNYIFKIFKYIKFTYFFKKILRKKKFKKFENPIRYRFGKKLKKKRKIRKYRHKLSYKLRFKRKMHKSFNLVLSCLKSKKSKINELVYFLKYFSVFRKRQSKIFNLSRIKSRLSKRKFFKKKIKSKKIYRYFMKKYKKLSYKQKKHINLINLDLYFVRNKRFFRLHRLYDIKRRYIRYLNNNRNIYKFYKYRTKHNYKFIKRHIRSMASLNINSRMHKYEFSLRNMALKLKYAYTFRNADIFIKSGFIFLNGLQEINPLKYIYKGDILELTFSKFLIKLKKKIKKKLNISMRKFKRYNWRTLKNKVNPEKRRLRISRFSEKILNFKIKLTKIIQFDYRTLSYAMISEMKYKKDLSYLNKKLLPIYLLKLFNWKLIS